MNSTIISGIRSINKIVFDLVYRSILGLIHHSRDIQAYPWNLYECNLGTSKSNEEKDEEDH